MCQRRDTRFRQKCVYVSIRSLRQVLCFTRTEKVIYLKSAFQGLRGYELYVRAVQTGHAITMQEFTNNGMVVLEK